MTVGISISSKVVITDKSKTIKPVVMPLSGKPVNSNNSLIFYKPGSLGSRNVGSTVRNSRAIARRT
jgi:hypothetical protein